MPEWLPGYALMTMFAHLAQFFFCGEGVPNTANGILNLLIEFFSFTSCGDLPGWTSFAFTMAFNVPWLFIGFTFLLPLFNNPVTGTIAGVFMLAGLIAVLGLTVAGLGGDSANFGCLIHTIPYLGFISWLIC